jgi:hypothetical protein
MSVYPLFWFGILNQEVVWRGMYIYLSIYSTAIHRHGDCSPVQRARERTDKLKTILIVITVLSAVHSGRRVLQK